MRDTYISIDLETTGLSPRRDKIIEIGAFKIENGEITQTLSSLINPGRRLDERIIDLTGIRDEDLTEAPYIEVFFPRLLDFMGDLPLLGHHVFFDYSFLKKAAVDQGIPFEKEGIDTLPIALKYLASLEHHNLGYLCAYYQIPIRAHRAYEDARATHFLYRELAEQFEEQEMQTLQAGDRKMRSVFDPKPLRFHIKKDSLASVSQKEQLYRLIHQHRIDISVDVERLTKSEASRLINQIRQRQASPRDGAK